MQDAWMDGIRASLPPGYGPQALYEAVSDALIAKFASFKTIRGLKGQWEFRAKLINEMEMIAPDAYRSTVDAYMHNIRRFHEDPDTERMPSFVGEGG
jgi:hypothetical protein